MIKNYFKIAWRNLYRKSAFSLINISGLALAIAVFLFILQYVGIEKSVNAFHENSDRIYRVVNLSSTGNSWPDVEPGWADIATERYGEIEDYCRIEFNNAAGVVENVKEKLSFRESKIGYTEGNFFDFFSFPLKSGVAADFNQPYVVFVSESAANKYFGEQNPMGKSLVLHNKFGDVSYTIKGIFEDIDFTSDIQYDMVFSLETLKNKENLDGNDWAALDNVDSQFVEMYFRLAEGADIGHFEANINTMRAELSEENDGVEFRVQALGNIHLGAEPDTQLATYASLEFVNILLGIAVLIMIVAWFNYINLSTANSFRNASEIGLRKAIGANKKELILQFLIRTALLHFIAFGLGIALVFVIQPFFNQIIGKEASILFIVNSPVLKFGLVVLFSGMIISGIFTAWSVSRFDLLDAIKGKISSGRMAVFLRQSLVVVQFSISIILIVGTIVVYKQVNYMQLKDTGIDKEQLVVISGPVGNSSNNTSAFAEMLQNQSMVMSYATSATVPFKPYDFVTSGFTHGGSTPDDALKGYPFVIIGEGYFPTYKVPFVSGRNFTAAECDVDWNDNSKVVINNAAVEAMGFASPEEAILTGIDWDERHLDIIGVTEDYHHKSLNAALDPIIFYPQAHTNKYTVRLSQGNQASKIAQLEKLYRSYFPGSPFDYYFMEEAYSNAYAEEEQYAQLLTLSSTLAIFIACMGLFGLAAFVVAARTKEIGIRKTLGASSLSLTSLMSADFLKLVGIAIIVATPIALFVVQKWLEDFAYPVELSAWIFVIAGVIALLIASLTVGIKSFRAALADPVKSLRSD